LVSRLARILDQERIVLRDHIAEQDAKKMAILEVRLDELRAQWDATERAYQPWISQPDERMIFERMRMALLSLGAPIAEVLAFSRAHLNDDAIGVLKRIRPRFEAIERQFDELVQINDDEASIALNTMSGARLELLVTASCLGLGLLIG